MAKRKYKTNQIRVKGKLCKRLNALANELDLPRGLIVNLALQQTLTSHGFIIALQCLAHDRGFREE